MPFAKNRDRIGGAITMTVGLIERDDRENSDAEGIRFAGGGARE
jgi:hypothetical protein